VALLAITSLWAYDFQSGDLYYNITSETTAEVTYENLCDEWDGCNTICKNATSQLNEWL
jgi:hypothetical protein